MIFWINECLKIKKTKMKMKIKYIAIKLECAHDDIFLLPKGAFKYYVIKEVGGWGQKITIFDDLQYCKSSWVGGPKKVKNMMT